MFREIGYFQGLKTGTDMIPYVRQLINTTAWSFRDRDECETNPDFKQLIPYIMVCCHAAGGHDGLDYLRYYRTQKCGEERLRGHASLGLGGHIEPKDMAGFDDDGLAQVIPPDIQGLYLMQGAGLRELFEEVALPRFVGPHDDDLMWQGLQIVGILNEDETEVGKVHLGVVCCVQVVEPHVTAKDAELRDPAFCTYEDLQAEKNPEGWTKILLEQYWQ